MAKLATSEQIMKRRALSFLASAASLDAGLPDLAARSLFAERLTGPVNSVTKESMILPLHSGRIVVMVVPRPLPADVLMDDLAQRVVWPGCQQAREVWASHIIVGSLHDVSSLAHARDTAEDVFHVVQSLLRTLPMEAVSWDGSGLFVQAADFTRMTEHSLHPPELLIRCQWRPSQAPISNALTVGTQGLRFFGLPELQDVTYDPDANAVRSRLLNLSSYLIANGPIIRDGDTIGIDERCTIKMRYGAGSDGNPVLSLHAHNG